AAPEELNRRRGVLAKRSSFLQDSELIGIERQLRDEKLARSRFRLKFAVRHLERRQEGVERLFEQFGWDRPKIIVAGFDRPDHHANLVWPNRAAHGSLLSSNLTMPRQSGAGNRDAANGFSQPTVHAKGYFTMRVLGIETTCDETAAAVVRLKPDGSGEILADEVMSQIAAHAPFGGVVPEIAARAHVEIIDLLIARALKRAQVAAKDLDGVAAAA